VLIGGLLSLLPYAIEKGAVSWLQQHGVDDARIANIDLNLLSGEALVEGLKSGDGLNIDHLRIDFDWLPLWHHIVHIRTLKLSKSNLHMLEQKGLWQVAGIKAGVGESDGAETQPGEQLNPWLVVVDDLVLDAVNVNVKTDLFSFSLPLKSLRLSLSALQQQQQNMVNHIEIGDTTFSGFGYKLRLAGATVAAEIALSLQNTDIMATLQTKQLSFGLRGLEIDEAHNKRQINISELTFDGIALADKDHIHVKSTRLKKLRIRHALNGQGDVRLAGVQIGGLDAGLNGDVAVAKFVLNKLSAEGIDGHRQSLLIAKTELADMASSPANQSGKPAARHIRIKSLGAKDIILKHAADDHGDVSLNKIHLAKLDIGLDGSIALARLALQKLSAEGIDGNRQSLFIAETEMADMASSPANQSGKPAARHIRIKSWGARDIVLKHAVDDRGNINLKKINLAKLDIGLDGSVNLAKLSLNAVQAEALSPDNHSVHLEDATLAGLSVRSGEAIRLKSLTMHKADLLAPNQRLAAFDHASLNQFIMHGSESGSFESLTFEGVQLPSDDTISLGSIGRIQARQAMLAKGGSYRVKQLYIDQLQAHLVKQKSGWLLPAGIGGQKQERSAQKGDMPQDLPIQPDSDTTKAQLVIDAVVVEAGSWIELHDESVTPALATTMQIEQFRFAPLDSSGNQRGKLDVQMKLGKSGALSLKGVTNVAAGKQLRADIRLVLKNFDLPRLSGYVEADLGKSIKTGQLNLDSDISIKNNTIDSQNKVLIRKLALEDSQHAHGSGPGISLAGGMSVDMALGMLLDDRGDVTLNVPVSGPLDNPDINLSHIINQALLTSLKTGALTYAALALQPYGSIILVADVARGMIKDAAKPKLTPVEFTERGTVLTSQMSDYITKVATMMQKRDFRLQVCGIATRIEAEKIIQPAPETGAGQAEPAYVAEPALDDKQLLELAQQRSDMVMAALRALGIDDKQVFNCHPVIDEAKQTAQPRVELLLDY